ncbi:MAG: hypothetical protein ACYCYM_00020 [Saccharofermentanales bacterium]
MLRRSYKILLCFLVISCLFQIIACDSNEIDNSENFSSFTITSMTSISSSATASEAEDTESDKAMKDFVKKILTATLQEDVKSFKEEVDKFGIYIVTYFSDGRDYSQVVHGYRNEIWEDFTLTKSQNKVGIGFISMCATTSMDFVKAIPIHSSTFLDEINFDVDWHINDEADVQNKIEDIVKTCEKIIHTNNEYIPQVFQLGNHIFAFTLSSSVDEPYWEFVGDWMIFEQVDNEYFVRAIINMQ